MVDLIVFVVVLGGLILGHELGHYLAMRGWRIEVEEFGLGFPPRLRTLFHLGRTRFTLNLIPLGGFVRPVGDDDPSVPGGLAAAPIAARATVLLAGPAANVLLALLAYTTAYRFAAPDLTRVLITAVQPGSPAAAAGVLPGDIVLSVDDTPIDGFGILQESIGAHLGEEVTITLERAGTQQVVTLVPRQTPPHGEGPIGVTLGNPTQPVGWTEAFSIGAQTTVTQFGEILRLPGRLINGELTPAEARVSGLKGMYDMLAWASEIDRSSQRPFLTLNLIGVISGGLAIANLLPFPALDGGRLMFVAFELVFRRRIAARYEGIAHAVGFAVLLVLMVYVNVQDFANPIKLP